MTGYMILLVILLVLAVMMGIRGPRWARLYTAAALFGFHTFVLAISFDGAARAVMAERVQANALSSEFEAGARLLKGALLPYRLMLFASGCGLFVLVMFSLSKK